ncbi:extracellular solute-binding protein [Patescibacteria group bacterium]|nr:MAG: extracellular solute-binding protein [Patescibacteria group bacterium]
MGNLSKFQLILIGVFAFFIIVGVVVFAFSKGKGQVQAEVTIWGTVPEATFSKVFVELPLYQDRTVSVRYVEKPQANFSGEYVEALARDAGPDIILAPHEVILSERRKLFAIPYNSFPERIFRDTFLEEGELFFFPEGILGLPLTVDPLLLYWNRDIFSGAGLAQPPKFWAEFFELSQKLTQRDGLLNITQSAVALGEYRNIRGSKELIVTLVMQAGNPIVLKSENAFASVLAETLNKAAPPAESALNFYTQFSNPAKPFYSWNRSLPDSQQMFLAGDLALYTGLASELPLLKLKNPNLNFDIALLPQSQSDERNSIYGKMLAFAISKQTRNLPAAFKVATQLIGRDSAKGFADSLSMAPARRDLLSRPPGDAFGAVLYQSALIARGWLDPNQEGTSKIFSEMIEDTTSGHLRLEQAIRVAAGKISELLKSW